ncbi:unnamed protein product, partial [marine sediment metagenome]
MIKLKNKIEDSENTKFTCNKCILKNTCKYAFDEHCHFWSPYINILHINSIVFGPVY